MAEEETVDWGDVETTSINPTASGGDDVISLGGAEELEEEVSPPKEEVAKPSNGKKVDEKPIQPAATPTATPVAEEAPVKALPPGWKLQQARSGGTYYFNTVTGKTTWEFPSEDADTRSAKATTGGEKLAGIQIKGAAKVAPSSEDDAVSTSKKRDAVSQAKDDVVAEEIPQKRRRSNTPEKKRDTWSASPEPKQRPAEPSRHRDDRARESKPNEGVQATSGWGRRPEIANEAQRLNGSQDARSRHYNDEPRGAGYSSRQYPEDAAGRDRGYQRGQNGDTAAIVPPNGRFVRPDNYEPDRSRPAYEDRRPSGREDADRSGSRRREPSPPPRRREEYVRGDKRETREELRDRDRDRERDREPVRREVDRDQYRGAERDRPRESASNEVRSDRNPQRGNDEDRRSVNRSEPSRASRTGDADHYERGDRSDRSASQHNQGYGNQGYNYMDRGSGSRPPRTPYSASDSNSSSQTGYGPQRGYGPRSTRPDAAVASPVSPATPFSPGGYGPRGMQPHPPGGARPVRPWIAPEEKAKKWWNKNSGEKKPVDPAAAAEAEENERRNRRSSSKQSVEPAAPVYRTDRERELAEREAAIARKERELGLK